MLNIFTEGPGRIRLVTKDTRSKRSSLKGILQSFTPLLFRFGGHGEAKTLRSTGAASLALPLSGITPYSGLHINKLISRVLEYETCFSALFFDYLNCIQVSAGAVGSPGPALRRFELALLSHLGHGVDFTHRADSGGPVDDAMTYRYREKRGFIASIMIDNATSTGRHLGALESREFPDADTLYAAKRFARTALKPYLGGKPLESRELFQQSMSKRR